MGDQPFYGKLGGIRAFIGSTLNYGVGIAAYLVLPAIALRKVMGIDPGPRFFPLRNDWWKDLPGGLGPVLGGFGR